jgi:antitoxin ParD1/3/4
MTGKEGAITKISKDCYYWGAVNSHGDQAMNISLTPQLERYVKQKVTSGMYNSVSEVVREAIRLLEERDRMQEMKLQALRADIQQGLDELDRGEGKSLDVESIKAKGRKMLASRNKD